MSAAFQLATADDEIQREDLLALPVILFPKSYQLCFTQLERHNHDCLSFTVTHANAIGLLPHVYT